MTRYLHYLALALALLASPAHAQVGELGAGHLLGNCAATAGAVTDCAVTAIIDTGVSGGGVDNAVLNRLAGVWTATSAPVLSTSITVPVVVGGSAVGSSLILKSTSAAGTTDFIDFLLGNNGAIRALRLLDSGGVVIGGGTTDPGTGNLNFSQTTALLSINGDSFLGRAGAANWRHGQADAAAPVAQTISVQNVVAGTTNTAGVNLTLNGSLGTGNVASGALIFQVGATANVSGSAQHAFTETMRISATTGATANTYVKFGGIGAGAMYITQDPLTRGSNYIGFWFSGATLPTASNYNLIMDVTGADAWLYWNAITGTLAPMGHRFQVGTTDALLINSDASIYAGFGADSPSTFGAGNIAARNFFISIEGFKRVSTQFDAAATTTLANVTGLSSTVSPGKTYRFRAVLSTSSAVAGGVKVAIAGTATATSIAYEGLTINAGSITQSRATALGTAVGAVTAVTAAEIIVEGMIVVNAGGTLTVQFAQNVASGTSSVLINSYFEVFRYN